MYIYILLWYLRCVGRDDCHIVCAQPNIYLSIYLYIYRLWYLRCVGRDDGNIVCAYPRLQQRHHVCDGRAGLGSVRQRPVGAPLLVAPPGMRGRRVEHQQGRARRLRGANKGRRVRRP